MEFLHFYIGQVSMGDVAVVPLDHQACVRLMDHSNFLRYRSGQNYRAIRLWAQASPARLRVPQPGHWHVVVDLDCHAGRIGAAVSVARRAA
jgi:hypothetical protein